MPPSYAEQLKGNQTWGDESAYQVVLEISKGKKTFGSSSCK